MRRNPTALRGAAWMVAVASIAIAQDPRPQTLPNFERRSPIVLAVENVGPAVVSIRTQWELTEKMKGDPRYGWQRMFQREEAGEVIEGHEYRERSQGSGVIVHPYGYVVTNHHVLWGADRITLSVQDGGAGKSVEATLINADVDNDIAVLKIKSGGPFPFARMGDSDRLLVGETTIALGNPFGLSSSVTTGIVSARNRSVTMRGEVIFKDFLQTSALINPGNSGGPLLDINGYVIGINVAIDNRGPGIGYAIPINRVREVAADLLDPEMVRHTWLGLDVTPANDVLRVEKVSPNSPAARAQMRPGDLIVAVGRKPVSTRLGFNIELLQYETGTRIPLTLRRDRDVEIGLAFEPLPPDEAQAIGRKFEGLGLVVSDITPVLAANFGLDPKATGAVITRVIPGGIAERYELASGDVVIQVGNIGVRDTGHLSQILRAYAARGLTEAAIRVSRKGKPFKGTIPLG